MHFQFDPPVFWREISKFYHALKIRALWIENKNKRSSFCFFSVLDILYDFWQIISTFRTWWWLDTRYRFFWPFYCFAFMVQFISFLSIVLPRNIKKIKVRYTVFVVPIKCTILGFYCKKTWIFIVVKRGFSWPFQSGIFIHFGPNEVLMNHRRRALPYIDTISYVTKFYTI